MIIVIGSTKQVIIWLFPIRILLKNAIVYK